MVKTPRRHEPPFNRLLERTELTWNSWNLKIISSISFIDLRVHLWSIWHLSHPLAHLWNSHSLTRQENTIISSTLKFFHSAVSAAVSSTAMSQPPSASSPRSLKSSSKLCLFSGVWGPRFPCQITENTLRNSKNRKLINFNLVTWIWPPNKTSCTLQRVFPTQNKNLCYLCLLGLEGSPPSTFINSPTSEIDERSIESCAKWPNLLLWLAAGHMFSRHTDTLQETGETICQNWFSTQYSSCFFFKKYSRKMQNPRNSFVSHIFL